MDKQKHGKSARNRDREIDEKVATWRKKTKMETEEEKETKTEPLAVIKKS